MDATDYPPREFLFEQRFAKIEIIVGIILLLVGVYQAVSLYRKDMVFALASLVAGCAAAGIFLMTFFRQPRRLTLDEQGLRVSYPAKKSGYYSLGYHWGSSWWLTMVVCRALV